MRYIPATAIAIAAALACACTVTHNVSSTPVPAEAGGNPVRIGSRVYVYSFVDMREKELGPVFMQSLERILAQELRKSGVESEQVWYARSPVKSLVERNVDMSGSIRVPVPEIVAANRDRETKFGARYRLVVIPADIVRNVSNVAVQTRWDLFDPVTNRSIWTGRASTFQVTWGANVDDGAEERAQKLVDAMLAEMKRVGLL